MGGYGSGGRKSANDEFNRQMEWINKWIQWDKNETRRWLSKNHAKLNKAGLNLLEELGGPIKSTARAGVATNIPNKEQKQKENKMTKRFID